MPLCDSTVKMRTDKMPDSVEEAVIATLKQIDYFSLQLDGSTYESGKANLLGSTIL